MKAPPMLLLLQEIMISNTYKPNEQHLSISPQNPTWKLYQNPIYISQDNHTPNKSQTNQIHNLKLPISAREFANSFWDLKFVRRSYMVSELDSARARILELKAELESERRHRKRAELVSKKLAKQLSEERKQRSSMQRMLDRLVKESSSDKGEIDRIKKEMEEERKMLRVAEVLREERVQMKLSEAKLLLEEKMIELENSTRNLKIERQRQFESSVSESPKKNQENDIVGNAEMRLSSETNSVSCFSNKNRAMVIRNPRTDPENPHIRRGIKGFVEFPKVVKAIGLKSKHLSSKLECQKAQLRLFLKQRSPIRSNIGFLTG